MRTPIGIASFVLLGLNVLAAAAQNPATVPVPIRAQDAIRAAASSFVDIVIGFAATDGTPLEAKLSVPAHAKGPVPVVFHLHGAGPMNYDTGVQYKDADGQIRTDRYYDFYARELASRGLAFFRMNKRGCSSDPSGRRAVDRSVFSKATPTVLLDDYAKALDALRGRKEIDTRRIVLSASSEGTRLAPQLALRSPTRIVGIVLKSDQADNAHNTVVWQNSIGPWRNVQKLIPAAADGTLAKAEYDAAATRDPSLATRMPFATIDTDADGIVNAAEMARVVRPRLDAILKAVEARNDDFLWQALGNLSAAYLLDGWDGEPTSTMLLRLNVAIGVFHGEVDGTTRVEGVRETEAAFRAAGRTNLSVHVYPSHGHDLNWTPKTTGNGGPVPYQDAFRFAADLVRQR